ncbi:MAG: NADH-quinone oxidoreductase subunit C [Acidobacteriota bacterium]|nr:NADH-quinone oxidoreductase subunit C [Acidobacteriota bacterium]
MSENDRDPKSDAEEKAPEQEAEASDEVAAEAEDEAKKAEAERLAAEAAEKKRLAAEAKAAAEAAKPIWERDPSPPTWSDADDDELVIALRSAFPDAITSARSFEDLTLVVTREAVFDLAKSLKEEHGFTYMVDVAGADYPDREERFEAVYHVYNQSTDRRVRFKVSTDEDTPVPSLTPVWKGCNWPEREAYDMYGIRFEGHPDMSRILLWEGFNGFPLRKEFPVEGIDTGSAIYPEYYEEAQGPISGDGTGWKVPKKPPVPPAEETAAEEASTEGSDSDA